MNKCNRVLSTFQLSVCKWYHFFQIESNNKIKQIKKLSANIGKKSLGTNCIFYSQNARFAQMRNISGNFLFY